MTIRDLLRPNIRNLVPYSSARTEYKGKASIFLDANESPFDNGYNRYPDPLQWELKQEIAAQKGVKPEQIFLGNGSDETLDLLIRAFCEPNKDNVLILPPTYGMYEVLANINGVECRKCSLNEDFSLNMKRLLNAIDQNTKIIFICSPNNPTGNSFEFTKIQELMKAFNGVVVIDEAYIDFSPKPSFIKKLNEYPYLFVSQTFSKSISAAGLRLGIGLSSPEIIQIMNAVKPPYNINSLTQGEGLNCIKDRTKIESDIATILAEKQHLFNALNELEIVVQIFPSDANFWLVRFENADLVYEALKQKGIIVRNRSNQLYCENTLRISIGTPDENQNLLRTLEAINQKTEIK